MKPSTESWGDGPTDVLLFDYLEGNLSEASAKELEERLASDSALQMELEHWKEAFVEPELYNTQLLEESLLQPPAKVISPSVSVFVVAFLTAVLSFLPFTPVKERVVLTRAIGIPALVRSADKKELVRQASKPALNKKLLPKSSFRHSIAKEVIKPFSPVEKLGEAELIQSKVLPLAVTQPESGLSSLDRRIKRMGFKKTPVARIITRKQQRKIERMKEKARQERAANQFLKGRVPYVVPLNTNNF